MVVFVLTHGDGLCSSVAVHSSTISVFAVAMEALHFSGVSGCSVGMNAFQGWTVCARLRLNSSAALGESLYVDCLRIVVLLLVHGACDDSRSAASLSRSGVAVAAVRASSVSGDNVFVYAAISGLSGVNTVLVHATISGVVFVHASGVSGCLGKLSSDPVKDWLWFWLTVFAAWIDFLYSDALASA